MAYQPINELICRTFLSRDMSHLAHWKTESYAEHKALADFYDGLVDKVDSIVELYQGLFGKIEHEEDEDLEEELEKITDILNHLKDDVKFLTTNRSKIANNVPAIENLIDDLVGFYGSTIYKLRFLA